ncbi:hypothetical protein C8035_v000784 [Colletotrichum spinosum]|uniref:Uncharacterized protein n=1 Tax=Colletotrichum spinosum TaxID=1347390 RepID=A0A4R8PVP7_9PEZI|nr:hypothetical protein C8035_v000784 [Colletotrichum spinosum]
MIILLIIIIIIRIIIIFNFYNFNILLNLIKTIDNHKSYSYFYKDLKRPTLYKNNFITFPNPLKIVIIISNFNLLLEELYIYKM